LDLEANRQVIESQIEDNLENGKEHAWLTKTPYWNLMLVRWVMRTKACEAQIIPTTRSAHRMDMGVFKESIVLDDDLHKERCNQLFIQMNRCIILFDHNLWFKVVEIKTEQGIL